MAKAASWSNTDIQVRKRGEQTGLDTLVVHALNDGCSVSVPLSAYKVKPSAGSVPELTR